MRELGVGEGAGTGVGVGCGVGRTLGRGSADGSGTTAGVAGTDSSICGSAVSCALAAAGSLAACSSAGSAGGSLTSKLVIATVSSSGSLRVKPSDSNMQHDQQLDRDGEGEACTAARNIRRQDKLQPAPPRGLCQVWICGVDGEGFPMQRKPGP